ncbi:hypothetical protein [Ornithobacterium rhinotracheale]|uniref:hypothetical protein n=5 Tax=Ornithobacterium rhinotracheale TaxID=28251 RepID=UPI001FF1C793|nr:hypothetical protein [Ornithobacterium rhinotracheale]MCK0200481.1 hypothetical protein [Ornithobacterium rhinotracheale]MCK0203221.1 hypothetical protein [Ornithobacterium rhinotracheale]
MKKLLLLSMLFIGVFTYAQQNKTLDNLTGNIRVVEHITVAEWAMPNTFALVQTGGEEIELPPASNYADGRIIAVNNSFPYIKSDPLTVKRPYAEANKPEGTSELYAGKGHILMAYKGKWYIISGSW